MWFAILTLPAAVAAYYRIFSGFAEWDDEGTQMMTVRQYLTGGRLYEEIYSGYGPVYFFYNWLIRSVTGMVLNHNTVRITSAVVALVCALIGAWIVFRLTNSLPAASVAHLLVFRLLSFFTYEPGHPQELCLLLLLCLAGSGMLASNPRRIWLAMAAAGCIAAGLTLVKINIGIFAILAVALAILFQSPHGWLWRTARYAAAGVAILLPVLLMRVHLDDPPAQAYCVVIVLSIAGVLAAARGFAPGGTLSFRECFAAAAGFAAILVLVLLVLTWQKVPIPATLDMLVLRHARFNVGQRFWYKAVELSRMWGAWALAGLGAAILVNRAMQSGWKGGVCRLLPPFQVLFGGTGLVIAMAAPKLLLGFATPFCWLLLYPRSNEAPRRRSHARILLCTAAVLQTLYAYPMAGSQVPFLQVLLVLVVAISLIDGLRSLLPSSRIAPAVRKLSRTAAAATLSAVALAYPVLAYRAERLYESLTPLNMPGAERIHAEKEEAEDYQWLVPQLRQNCDTFISLPGIPSLYFWTGKPMPGPVHQPPGPLNYGQWMDMFFPEEQKAIMADFSEHPNACAVYHPSGVDSWNTGKQDVRGWPLANYILTHFKTIGQSGDYQFMIRNERHLEIPDGVRRELRRQSR